MTKAERRRLREKQFFQVRSKKQYRRIRRKEASRIFPPPRESSIKVTRKQKRKRRDYDKSQTTIRCPEKFDILENAEGTLKFFEELRNTILIKPRRHVAIDHQQITHVSPAAGIILIAELFRGHAYAPRCIKTGNLPQNNEVAELFEKIGYWKYFGVLYRGKTKSNRQFMIHKSGNRITPQLIAEVIKHFREAVSFSRKEESSLYIALIECLDNVMTHAYPYREKYDPPCLRHQWWVLAYRDSVTHEVCVCFYDQGVGIPETIKARSDPQMSLIEEKDGEIVIDAVLKGHKSRRLSGALGTGLPSLKSFIDVANSGELIIATRGVMCVFPHGSVPHYKDLTKPLPGTLIQWRFSK